MTNLASVLQATGSVNIGQTNYDAGTPASVSLSLGRIQAGNLSIYSLSDLTLSSITANLSLTISLYAKNTISLSNGSLLTAGVATHVSSANYTLSSDSKLSPTPTAG